MCLSGFQVHQLVPRLLIPYRTGRYVPDLRKTGNLYLKYRSGSNLGYYRRVPAIPANLGRDGGTRDSDRYRAERTVRKSDRKRARRSRSNYFGEREREGYNCDVCHGWLERERRNSRRKLLVLVGNGRLEAASKH